MTNKITTLFATVAIAGILSMAPFMAMPNQAFAGVPILCTEPVPATLDILLSSPTNCIIVDDKQFDNFRNFNGGITFFDGGNAPFNPADITVTGVTINGEHGLVFTPNPGALLVFNGINPAASPQAIGIVFDYDVIASEDLISDNTLTMVPIVSVAPGTAQTRVQVTEQVHGELDQSDNPIAFKEVFEDGTGAFDHSEHVDFAAPDDSISVNTDIGLILDPQVLGSAEIIEFVQTFSQTPREVVGGEFLPIDSTALLIAGMSANLSLIVPIAAGIAGVGAYYIKTRMNKE